MQNNANELRGNMRLNNPSVGDCELREVESETKAALGKGPHDAHLKQVRTPAPRLECAPSIVAEISFGYSGYQVSLSTFAA